MTRRTRWKAVLAVSSLALALGVSARAEETPSVSGCVASPLAESTASEAPARLEALRPTLLIVAADYEKQAQEYAKEAERSRTWANAEDMFGSAYGKRYAALYYAEEARELEAAAEQSRMLAAKYRALAESPKAASGC